MVFAGGATVMVGGPPYVVCTVTAYDRWRDAEGTRIPEGCRVEQVGVARDRGALRSRLGKTGTVVARSQKGTRLRVRFDGESGVVSIQPLLVRVLPRVVTAQQVIAEREGPRQLPPPAGIKEGCADDVAPDRPLTPGEVLAKLFLDNAANGRNAANDELVAALLQRGRAIQALAESRPDDEP